jgi:hypothetical protein
MSTYERAIGPLLTNSGLRAWSLFLARDALIARPYGFTDGVKLAFHLYCGFPADPGESLRRQPTAVAVSSDAAIRYYSLSEVGGITVVVSAAANQVVIAKAAGGEDRYDIPKRPLTRVFMETLRGMYPALYREQGIPTTPAGRVLKA